MSHERDVTYFCQDITNMYGFVEVFVSFLGSTSPSCVLTLMTSTPRTRLDSQRIINSCVGAPEWVYTHGLPGEHSSLLFSLLCSHISPIILTRGHIRRLVFPIPSLLFSTRWRVLRASTCFFRDSRLETRTKHNQRDHRRIKMRKGTLGEHVRSRYPSSTGGNRRTNS